MGDHASSKGPLSMITEYGRGLQDLRQRRKSHLPKGNGTLTMLFRQKCKEPPTPPLSPMRSTTSPPQSPFYTIGKDKSSCITTETRVCTDADQTNEPSTHRVTIDETRYSVSDVSNIKADEGRAGRRREYRRSESPSCHPRRPTYLATSAIVSSGDEQDTQSTRSLLRGKLSSVYHEHIPDFVPSRSSSRMSVRELSSRAHDKASAGLQKMPNTSHLLLAARELQAALSSSLSRPSSPGGVSRSSSIRCSRRLPSSTNPGLEPPREPTVVTPVERSDDNSSIEDHYFDARSNADDTDDAISVDLQTPGLAQAQGMEVVEAREGVMIHGRRSIKVISVGGYR